MAQPRDVDLNLLVALDVLLDEGSVTGAAERLHLSVPATSRTLARIRRAFGDPILVRAGRGLVPTPHALAIHDEVHRLVTQAGVLFETAQPFDPARLERRFTIRANDGLVTQLAPPLLAHLAQVAPGVTLRFAPEGEEDLPPLRDGSVDLDVGVVHDLGPEVRTAALYEDDMVGLVAPGHPLSRRRVTLKRLARVPHVSVSRRGRDRGPLDDVLAREGLSRRVVAVVPTYTAAAFLILGSDATVLVAGFAARQIAASTGAHVYRVPAPLPPLPIAMAWHARHDTDPVHRWMRLQVHDITTRETGAVGRRAPVAEPRSTPASPGG